MKAIRMDFVRSGDDAGIIQKQVPYHVVIGSSEHRQFQMPLSHEEFLDLLVCLRYHSQISDDGRREALTTLGEIVTSILNLSVPNSEELVQIDLVTNAKELYALPFEAALGPDKKPLFVNEAQPMVLTRRAPQEFAEKPHQWPARPRVLFAYASPSWIEAPSVPARDHKDALLKALQPWIDPLPDVDIAIGDEKTVLTTLTEASLEDIREEIKKGLEENKAYTHVHLLAHGVEMKDPIRPFRQQFGVAFRSENKTVTTPEEIVDTLLPKSLDENTENTSPVLVTLAICDGGNQSNTIVKMGSLAQELHRAGVPIVVASQLPLTFPGSKIMTEALYQQWMEGEDIRKALLQARVKLYQAKETTYNDWVGMVAYVRLPEGYHDYLMEIRLQSQLAALETASKYADILLEKSINEKWQYEQVTSRIQQCINSLDYFLHQYEQENIKAKTEVIQENTGLLGSAYKRLSELLFRRSTIETTQADQLKKEGMAALEKACQVYREGFLHNTSHHWSGVQYLALQAVLSGTIEKIGEWYSCHVAAEGPLSTDYPINKRVWALGSLAELNLLASVTEGVAYKPETAKRQLQELYQKVQENSEIFKKFNPILSTRRQLSRYVNWWTKENGFFKNTNSDLSNEAKQFLSFIEG